MKPRGVSSLLPGIVLTALGAAWALGCGATMPASEHPAGETKMELEQTLRRQEADREAAAEAARAAQAEEERRMGGRLLRGRQPEGRPLENPHAGEQPPEPPPPPPPPPEPEAAPAPPPPPANGCGKDTDCKGDRICVDGRCVPPR